MKRIYQYIMIAAVTLIGMGGCADLYNDDISQIDGSLQSLHDDDVALQAEIEAKIAALRSNIYGRLDTMTAHLDRYTDEQVAQLNKRIANGMQSLRDRVATEVTNLPALNADVEYINARLDASISGIDQLKASLTAKMNSGDAALQAQINSAIGNLDNLETRLAKDQKTFEAIEARFNYILSLNLVGKIEDMNASLAAIAAFRDGYDDYLAAFTEEMDNLAIARSKEEYAALYDDLLTAETKIADLEAAYIAMEKLSDDLLSQLDDAMSYLDDADDVDLSEWESLQSQLDWCNDKFEDMQNQIEDAVTSVQEIYDSVDFNEDVIDEIDAIDAYYTEYEDKLFELELLIDEITSNSRHIYDDYFGVLDQLEDLLEDTAEIVTFIYNNKWD